MKIQAQDVIHLESAIQSLRFPQTFRSDELLKDIVERLIVHRNNKATDDKTAFYSSGLNCEILQANGKGWQKGKARVSLEFIPDNETDEDNNSELEVESPQTHDLNSFRDSAA